MLVRRMRLVKLKVIPLKARRYGVNTPWGVRGLSDLQVLPLPDDVVTVLFNSASTPNPKRAVSLSPRGICTERMGLSILRLSSVP
jgi:hypothetical protein